MLESLFVPTLIVALAEIGDKTQLLALLLAARFRNPLPIILGIVVGTTLGMLIANVPVVLVGNFAAERLPLTLIRRLAAGAFAALAAYASYQALQLGGHLWY